MNQCKLKSSLPLYTGWNSGICYIDAYRVEYWCSVEAINKSHTSLTSCTQVFLSVQILFGIFVNIAETGDFLTLTLFYSKNIVVTYIFVIYILYLRDLYLHEILSVLRSAPLFGEYCVCGCISHLIRPSCYRIVTGNNTNNKSESDQEDNDDVNDNDWSYGAEKKGDLLLLFFFLNLYFEILYIICHRWMKCNLNSVLNFHVILSQPKKENLTRYPFIINTVIFNSNWSVSVNIFFFPPL